MTDLVLWGRSLLPGNAAPLERCLSEAFAEAFAALPQGSGITEAIQADAAPAILLPWLAWEWSVDEWQTSWPASTQRAVIKASWDVHAHKGTVFALERAVQPLGYGAEIAEWWQTGRPPFTFRFQIDSPAGRVWTGAELEQLYRIALRVKNVRSWLEATAIHARGPEVPVFAGAVVSSKVRARPSTEPVTTLAATPPLFVAALVRTQVRAKPTV